MTIAQEKTTNLLKRKKIRSKTHDRTRKMQNDFTEMIAFI